MIPGAESLSYKCYPLGDSAISIQLPDEISTRVNTKISQISAFLDEYSFEGLIEYVPAYSSLTIYFQPSLVRYEEITEMIDEMMSELATGGYNEVSRLIEIPVVYGGESGPDLSYVAQYHHLSEDEVIRIHSEAEYQVYMIGFAPGFPYLGGLDDRIATPRRSSPRAKVWPGAVGIAGAQTGIYPLATPGGWQIIGQTSLTMFDINQEQPSLLRAGDRIKFVAVTGESEDEVYGI